MWLHGHGLPALFASLLRLESRINFEYIAKFQTKYEAIPFLNHQKLLMNYNNPIWKKLFHWRCVKLNWIYFIGLWVTISGFNENNHEVCSSLPTPTCTSILI